MSKKIVQDVVPPNERTIRRIPLSERQKTKFFPSERIKEENPSTPTPPNPPKKKKWKKFLWWGIGILVLLILIRLFAFAEAEVIIKPKQETINLNETFLASKEINSENNSIPFKVIEVSEKLEKTAEAVGEEEVERKASGEIVIFNNHSTNSQPLVQNTRFETPEGLIFRINEPITVPGMTERNGEKVPGQLKVKVYADQPGEKYNTGLTDFTIPGFEGLPQFDNFFARSSTKMSGGFVGTVKTVDSEDLEMTRVKLQSELNSLLAQKMSGETPEGFFLLDESLSIDFENSIDEKSEQLVSITEIGTAYAIILDKEKLEAVLSENSLRETAPIKIANLETLNFNIIGDSFDVKNSTSFELNIEGNPQFVWVVSEEDIKRDLAGEPRRNLQALLSKYSSIDEAEAATKPFWKRSFPKDEEKIYIEIVY